MPDLEPPESVSVQAGQPVPSILKAFTCTLCGCLCDDLSLVGDGNRLHEARNACDQAREWLLSDRSRLEPDPAAQICGNPASAIEAIRQTARLMRVAKAPVILGLSRVTNETVAASLGIAEQIGALIDPDSPRALHPWIMAFQRAGRVSATLGEVKNRADAVVFWGADPLTSHPRHWERYSVGPVGRFVPKGREGRDVIVLDMHRTATAEVSDLFVQIDQDRQFEVIWTLRAILRGAALDPERVRRATACDLSKLQALALRLSEARYGAMFYGPSLGAGTMSAATATIEAAYGLVRDLNRKARFVILGMGGPGNAHGVEAVLAWQTGFPCGVDLGSGHPESIPGVTTANERLARGEADLAFIVGELAIEDFDALSRTRLEQIPTIVMAPPEAVFPWSPSIRLFCATPGLRESGTVMRGDGVALPVRSALSTRLPSCRAWLEATGLELSKEPALDHRHVANIGSQEWQY